MLHAALRCRSSTLALDSWQERSQNRGSTVQCGICLYGNVEPYAHSPRSLRQRSYLCLSQTRCFVTQPVRVSGARRERIVRPSDWGIGGLTRYHPAVEASRSSGSRPTRWVCRRAHCCWCSLRRSFRCRWGAWLLPRPLMPAVAIVNATHTCTCHVQRVQGRSSHPDRHRHRTHAAPPWLLMG